MRCRLWCVLSVLVHCSGLAWNSRLSGIQISKLNRRSGPGEGQPDNRKFNEPSATRQTQFYWTRLEEFLSVWPHYQPTWSYLNGRRGSCLGAAVNAVTPVVEVGAQMRAPSLERGIPKKPLFCTVLRDITMSSHMVNAPVQEITAMEGC